MRDAVGLSHINNLSPSLSYNMFKNTCNSTTYFPLFNVHNTSLLSVGSRVRDLVQEQKIELHKYTDITNYNSCHDT